MQSRAYIGPTTTSSAVPLFDMVAISQVVTILLATVAFAAPPSDIESHVTRRHRSRLMRRVERDNLAISSTAQEDYSTNWAGAVLEGPNGTYTLVRGTFVVPTLSSPDGSATAWVGIDGGSCSGGLWRTGIDMTHSNGAVSYDAWYQWYPDVAYYFNDVTIKTGDTVRLIITADSNTSGLAVVDNLSSDRSVSQYITSTHALCEQSAEWIVEDHSQVNSDGDVPFYDFGNVTFSDCSAHTSTGGIVSPRGANIIDIQQDGLVLTSTTQHSKVVKISYVG